MTLSGLSPPAIGPDLDAPQAPTTRSTHFSIRNIRIIRKIHPLRTILRIVRILRIRGSRAKRMNRSLALIRPGRLPREQSLRELSALLARGYLRLLASGRQGSEIAPNPALRESATGSPNSLDVAGRAKHELGRGVRHDAT